MIEALNKVPIGMYDVPSFHDKVTMIEGTINRLTYFVSGAIAFIARFVGTIGVLALATQVRWYFGAAGLVVLGLRAFVSHGLGKEQAETWQSMDREERMRRYTADLAFNPEFVKEVRTLDLEEMIVTRWRRIADRMRAVRRALVLRTSRLWFSCSLADLVYTCGVLLTCLLLVRQNGLTLGGLTLMWQLSRQLGAGIRETADSFFEARWFLGVLHIHRQLLDQCAASAEQPVVAPSHDPLIYSPKPARPGPVIELRDVRFSYGDGPGVLKGVNLSIPKGQVVALCGENGEGKTTLVKLILGFYPPSAGEVLFQGHRYGELERNDLLYAIGVVLQQYARYLYSFRENIGFGLVGYLRDDAALWDAAEKGGAADMIRSLPGGTLDQPLGRWLNNGAELSGGQWQRLTISRGYVGDRDVLIMDEPAAQLDPLAEYEQFRQARDIVRSRTALLVSHRMGFARLADRIVVLKDGIIAEDGTHEELMDRRGAYHALFTSQAKWYAAASLP
jgi:ABC-type multidrug transport system fused ATPase/permease subunit